MSANKEFYHFLQKHIAEKTKPAEADGTTMPNVHDLEQSIIAGGFPDPAFSTAVLDDEDYMDWAEMLKSSYNWVDRRPAKLWYSLKAARKEWVEQRAKITSQHVIEPTKVSTSPAAKVEITPTGARKMDRAFSAISDVDIEDDYEDVAASGDLHDKQTNVYRMCDFCNKETPVYDRTGKLLQRLTGDRGFYCPFCVRHGFYTRGRKDVLVLTFRGLIGYMYSVCYFGREPRIYLSQLQDLVQQHVDVGHLNPLFVYDPDTFCWFVDFAKVGESKRKIPVQEVLRTTNEIISAFNPYLYIRSFNSHFLTKKYTKAIMEWYQHRQRPEGRAILSPTMKGCGDERREIREGATTTTTVKYKKVDVTAYRDFLPQHMRHHSRR